MSVEYLKSRTGFDACGSVVSVGGTGKETLSTGLGNDIDSEGGTVSDMLTEACEKYETDSKNVTSANIKYFLVEVL